MNGWLLTPDALQEVRSAYMRMPVPTAEQQLEFTASFQEGDYPGARIMTKAGGVAYINITGVLSKEPSWILKYFAGGNTAYSEIISAINEAERDPEIQSAIFSIDSPGGQTSGLTMAMDAIKNMTIPTKAEVFGMAASAAYGLASQTDSIVALDRGAIFGSIGVKGSFLVNENVIEITSSNAPEKAPDVTTEDGKKIVQKYLDQIEAVFIEDIAEGRKTTIDKVKSDFGRGGVFLAHEAKSHGMIDDVKDNKDRSPGTGATTTTEEASTNMNLQELQAKYPETFAAAVDVGVMRERKRASAHLKMGEASGDLKLAIEAIGKGDDLDQEYTASYLAAGMKNGQIAARQQETTDANPTVTPGAAKPDEATEAAVFLDALGA